VPAGRRISYWIDSTDATSYEPLRDGTEVDVAVIGAGIAGLTAAYLLAREERSVAVDLEQASNFVCGESPDDAERIRAEVEAAVRLGLPASFVTETPLPYEVSGAIRLDDQAQFHPRKYPRTSRATSSATACDRRAAPSRPSDPARARWCGAAAAWSRCRGETTGDCGRSRPSARISAASSPGTARS
jgi:choline dehydrogenase-like flavoprotein